MQTLLSYVSPLIAVLSVLGALLGGTYALGVQGQRIDQMEQRQTEDRTRTDKVPILEEAVKTIKEDTKEIRDDVKMILKAVGEKANR